MSTGQILEQLRTLSDPELRVVIEAASRLIEETRQASTPADPDVDPILRVAGILSGAPISADDIDPSVYSIGPG
jgi:hypothetical protein